MVARCVIMGSRSGVTQTTGSEEGVVQFSYFTGQGCLCRWPWCGSCAGRATMETGRVRLYI